MADGLSSLSLSASVDKAGERPLRSTLSAFGGLTSMSSTNTNIMAGLARSFKRTLCGCALKSLRVDRGGGIASSLISITCISSRPAVRVKRTLRTFKTCTSVYQFWTLIERCHFRVFRRRRMEFSGNSDDRTTATTATTYPQIAQITPISRTERRRRCCCGRFHICVICETEGSPNLRITVVVVSSLLRVIRGLMPVSSDLFRISSFVLRVCRHHFPLCGTDSHLQPF